MTKRLVLASGNLGKLAEFNRFLQPLGFDLCTLTELGISEADEPYLTFIENALAKARHVARLSGLPALADDSGICVPALGGAPGVLSARFAGEPKSDQANNTKLVAELREHSNKSAYYYCALVYIRSADDPQPVIAEGRWDGEIIETARGQGGFGYDPHFWVASLGKTAAELEPAEKNQLSHRGQALRQLVAKLS